MMGRHPSDYFCMVGELIFIGFQDYVNYKKAQRILGRYYKKAASGTSCGIVNKQELEALAIVFDHEQIKKNREETKLRIKKIKEDSLMVSRPLGN